MDIWGIIGLHLGYGKDLGCLVSFFLNGRPCIFHLCVKLTSRWGQWQYRVIAAELVFGCKRGAQFADKALYLPVRLHPCGQKVVPERIKCRRWR